MFSRWANHLGDGLTGVGALALFGSLFLTWSHQLSPAVLRLGGPALAGVPANPTGWQVYSAADVVLTIVAAVLVAGAVAGRLVVWLRWFGLGCALVALAFVAHALAVPPTNGVVLAGAHGYVASGAGAGPGETLAIVGLGLAVAGMVCARRRVWGGLVNYST